MLCVSFDCLKPAFKPTWLRPKCLMFCFTCQGLYLSTCGDNEKLQCELRKKREKHLASVDFHQAVHLPQVVTFNSTVLSRRLGRSSSRLHLWYLWSKPLSLDLGGGHEEELSWVHDYHIQKVKGPWWVSQILLQDRGCVRAQISSDTPSTTQNKECCFLAPGDRFVFNLFEIYLSLNVVFVVVFIERLHHTRLFNDFCA